jgi:hypothetical protein
LASNRKIIKMIKITHILASVSTEKTMAEVHAEINGENLIFPDIELLENEIPLEEQAVSEIQKKLSDI